jgi:hypothetical protein
VLHRLDDHDDGDVGPCLTLGVLLAGLAFAHALCGRLVDARDAITLERRTNR